LTSLERRSLTNQTVKKNLNSNGVIYGVKKYVASSANWKKKIELEELKSIEDTIFEASTRAVEWALDSGKEVGIFIYLKDPEFEHREYMSLSYKVLSNAGHYKLAEFQRQMVKEDFDIDIAQEPLDKIVIKLHKASLKRSFCIAKLTEVSINGRACKIPIVCVNIGLFEEEEDAKDKCKELNKTLKKKIFSVKKITYNI
jgi:hypothetical protein